MSFIDSEDKWIIRVLFLSFLFLILCWIYRDSGEVFNGGDEIYDYVLVFSQGYIVSFIFYYINILYPKVQKRKSSCIYIGDCLAYYFYNIVNLSDAYNLEPEKTNIRVLNHRGSRIRYAKGTKINFNELEQNVRKENIYLLNRIFDYIRTYIPSEENSFVDFYNRSLDSYLMITSCNHITSICKRDQIIKSQNIVTEKLGYNCTKYLELIVKQYNLKRNLILQNEDNLDKLDLNIRFGSLSDKLAQKI